jgi:uncharacterized protein with von Willebrand factor type A (vWA) domain
MTELQRRWRLILGPAAEAAGDNGAGAHSASDTPAQPGDADADADAEATDSRSSADAEAVERSGRGQGIGPSAGGIAQLNAEDAERDRLLDYLYRHEYAEREFEPTARSRRGGRRSGGLGAPEWLRGVRRLFPASTVEHLQREGLQRYGLTELLTDPEVLAQAQPSMDLVRTLLSCRSLLPPESMGEARRLIRSVISELEARLARSIRARFQGRRRRGQHGGRRSLAELDWPTTLRRNLKHYDHTADALVLRQLYFHARQQRQMPWELVLLVDQSGSMLDSVIHAAVVAAVFSGLPMLKTRLILFDTRIVDLGEQLADPVETLLGLQLGGGTDIAAAMVYAADRIQQPSHSLLVLISDFYEGGDGAALLEQTRRLAGSGVKLLGLAALDREAQPDYDHQRAQELAACGMAIGAMTPDHLADWVAKAIA